MKTKVINRSSHDKEHIIINSPYTIFVHTTKFYEWWAKQPKDPTKPISPREAWNAAIDVASKIVESQSFSIKMNVGGLKKMIEDLGDDDSFRIEIFHDRATEYSFIKGKH